MGEIREIRNQNNSTLSCTMPLDDNGKKHDKVINYFGNGAIHIETIYNHGVKEGPQTEYYRNGKPSAKRNYKNNKMDGVQYAYHENGVVSSKDPFVEGIRHGIAEYYNEKGILTHELLSINGKAIMKRDYDANGNFTGGGSFLINYIIDRQIDEIEAANIQSAIEEAAQKMKFKEKGFLQSIFEIYTSKYSKNSHVSDIDRLQSANIAKEICEKLVENYNKTLAENFNRIFEAN